MPFPFQIAFAGRAIIMPGMKRLLKHDAGKLHGLKLVREERAGSFYEYYPLGRYIVIAPGVCGGRPTFKGTRVEVRIVLDALRRGETIPEILDGYPTLSRAAVEEAIQLATRALSEQYALQAA